MIITFEQYHRILYMVLYDILVLYGMIGNEGRTRKQMLTIRRGRQNDIVIRHRKHRRSVFGREFPKTVTSLRRFSVRNFECSFRGGGWSRAMRVQHICVFVSK